LEWGISWKINVMEIRQKLSFQFITIVALILLLSFISIYISVSRFRKETFYDRIESRALTVAQLLIDVEEVNAELLKKIEKTSTSSLNEEQIAIYDFRNDVIYSTDELKFLKIDDDKLNQVRLSEYVRYNVNNFEILGIYYKSKYDRFVVFAGALDVFGFEKIRNLRLILIIVFFFSLIVVFLAGMFFSDRALRPILKVMAQVAEIGVSNLDQRVDEGNGNDEIAQLAATFNKMLERIESAFKIQKSFIANASHELRTPLTIITGQLEVVLLKERPADEYYSVIRSVLDDIKNLNFISNRLLLLAQTSSDLVKLNLFPVRVDDLLWDTSREIMKRFPEYSVHINMNPALDDETLLTVTGSELLLKTVFSNLIENACKYSPKEKSVFIDIITGSDQIAISFSDHGIGIPNEDIKMIFQPFYRGKNSMEFNGNGIGLSLADRIVIIHSGTIEVKSVLGEGSEFILKLPLSGNLPKKI
jgi:signal transduction histidine kinase